MSQFVKDHLFEDWPAAGTIIAPVFCAARMVPAFGIFAGPWGPSGVIATIFPGVFHIFIILSTGKKFGKK